MYLTDARNEKARHLAGLFTSLLRGILLLFTTPTLRPVVFCDRRGLVSGYVAGLHVPPRHRAAAFAGTAALGTLRHV